MIETNRFWSCENVINTATAIGLHFTVYRLISIFPGIVLTAM